jgi:hypothetical protein
MEPRRGKAKDKRAKAQCPVQKALFNKTIKSNAITHRFLQKF